MLQSTHFVCFFCFFFYSVAKWLCSNVHSPPSRPFQQFFTTDIISPHQNQYYFSTCLALPSFSKALSFYVVYARKEHGFAFHFQIFDHRYILNHSNFSEVTHTVRRLIQYVWIGFYFLSKWYISYDVEYKYRQMHTLKEVAYQQLIIKIQSVFSPYIDCLKYMNFERDNKRMYHSIISHNYL